MIEERKRELFSRFRSPVLWISALGLIYSVVLVPMFEGLPSWTSIVGLVCGLFGIANNPTNSCKF